MKKKIKFINIKLNNIVVTFEILTKVPKTQHVMFIVVMRHVFKRINQLRSIW
ncbi:hypothetical protein HanHA300_Chr11g0416621 [Helianthus annuus]|nr:hypothetical protein HanHA300_Chr11g0416621 [Helianthus annuus]KAJ0518723.1 hypothetical protein HanHA89_Chr11g0440651 [Helianthus annuus]